jgi:hypothetical protein
MPEMYGAPPDFRSDETVMLIRPRGLANPVRADDDIELSLTWGKRQFKALVSPNAIQEMIAAWKGFMKKLPPVPNPRDETRSFLLNWLKKKQHTDGDKAALMGAAIIWLMFTSEIGAALKRHGVEGACLHGRGREAASQLAAGGAAEMRPDLNQKRSPASADDLVHRRRLRLCALRERADRRRVRCILPGPRRKSSRSNPPPLPLLRLANPLLSPFMRASSLDGWRALPWLKRGPAVSIRLSDRASHLTAFLRAATALPACDRFSRALAGHVQLPQRPP